jgi:IS30 family transposase
VQGGVGAGKQGAVPVERHGVSGPVRHHRGLRGYRPKQAQHLALARREAKAKPRIASGTWEWVESLLCEEWSPEQVSGWLSMEQGLHVSHEWICQYVYADKHRGGDLHAHLRCQKRRRKRYGSNDRRGQIRGAGFRLTSGRRSSRNAPAPETGRPTP